MCSETIFGRFNNFFITVFSLFDCLRLPVDFRSIFKVIFRYYILATFETLPVKVIYCRAVYFRDKNK